MRSRVVILQGGAMRAAFGAGVLYELAQHNLFADVLAAASASTPTAMYYAARQLEDMRAIWLQEVGNNRFIRFDNLITGKPIYDIEYLINDVFKKKYPLFVETIVNSPTKLVVPLYNYREKQLEVRTSKDSAFSRDVWALLHLSMIVHDKHILWGTPFEKYVDGALDPFVLYKLDYIPIHARVVVIWNEPRFDMHFIKHAGQKLFLALQSRNFPEEVRHMLRIRAQLITDGMRIYTDFCQCYNPLVIKPDRLSIVDGLDVLSRNNGHLERLFEHGREKARLAVDQNMSI